MSFARGIVLTRLDALPDPGVIVVAPHPDEPFVSILVTRKGESIAAFRNKCPHAGYPLQRSNGQVLLQEGRYIVCAAHGASFGLISGECAAMATRWSASPLKFAMEMSALLRLRRTLRHRHDDASANSRRPRE